MKYLIILLLLVPGVSLACPPEPTSNVVSDTNQQRVSYGLTPLKEVKLLDEIAMHRAKYLFYTQVFSHDYWAHPFRNMGYCMIGENLSLAYESNVVVSKWMESSSHRANVLMEGYREIGVATIRDKWNGFDTLIIVQVFGTKCESN